MKKVLDYLDNILKNNHRIVLACSGGPDSMALLFLLCELKEKYQNEIIVCHIKIMLISIILLIKKDITFMNEL